MRHNHKCWETYRKIEKTKKYSASERKRLFHWRIRELMNKGMNYGKAVWKASKECK